MYSARVLGLNEFSNLFSSSFINSGFIKFSSSITFSYILNSVQISLHLLFKNISFILKKYKFFNGFTKNLYGIFYYIKKLKAYFLFLLIFYMVLQIFVGSHIYIQYVQPKSFFLEHFLI